jgi:selenocysteine-specific elongation factor
VRELVRQGLLVDCGGVFFTPEAVADARRLIAAQLAEAPEGITLAELRDALATSRRFALALLEYFDSQGATRRRGDRRVAGPRLEVPDAFGAADRAPPTRNSFDVD